MTKYDTQALNRIAAAFERIATVLEEQTKIGGALNFQHLVVKAGK